MLLRALSGMMAAVFLFATAVQYNDPDPIRWMTVYGAACMVSMLVAARPQRVAWFLPAAIGLVATAWAAMIAPGVIGRVGFSELFVSMQMKTEVIEEGRETAGLLIVAAWMAVLAVASRPARRLGDGQPVRVRLR